MKTRKWPLLLMAILTVLSMSSCQDWGEADPPAGNQKLPAKPDTSAKLIAEFTFDEDFNSTATEGETPVSGEVFAYSADQEIPEIVQDDEEKVELCTPTADTSAFPTLLSVQISRQESHLVSS